MDIGTIKSRIVAHSIKSAKDLFRDLLLLANNALVFYSRRTREYKAAVTLRKLVMKEYKLHCRGSCHEATSAFIPCNPPVKPRTALPHPGPRPPACKDREKARNTDIPVSKRVSAEGHNNVLKQSLLKTKKGLKRAVKLESEAGDDPPRKNTTVKQRKRVRR